MSFMGGLACEQLRNQLNELKETVWTINFVTLKPNTETIVRVSWLKTYRSEVSVVLEPMTHANKPKFWTARSVVVPTGRTTICKVCNAMFDTITLKRGTPLATIERIDINAITVMESITKTATRAQEKRDMEWSKLEEMEIKLDMMR